MDENVLTAKLNKIKESGPFDPKALDSAIRAWEEEVPEGCKLLLQTVDEATLKEFRDSIHRKFEEDGKRKPTELTATCMAFYKLIALLQFDLDATHALPEFATADDVHKQPEATLATSRLHLANEEILRNYVELLLSALGHEHEGGAGTLNAKRAGDAFTALRDHWGAESEIFYWIVPYLALRLMRRLVNMDMFYAMHAELPHYLECKILTYLLWLIGRGAFDPIHRFAELSLQLYNGISQRCGDVLRANKTMEELQQSVEDILRGTHQKLHEAGGGVVPHDTSMSSLTVEITKRFFSIYMNELSAAGRTHVVLWTLPMFMETKNAFRSIAELGTRGINILIIGETGTGKESLAELFLKSSGKPYVSVNCAGMRWRTFCEDLFESGDPDEVPLIHTIGALFLDELDKAELDTQGGLLQLLDKPYGRYRFAGDLRTYYWSGLTIAAATEDIYRKVQEDRFLPDLFWRFDVRARISPLRDMVHDTNAFIKLFSLALGVSRAKYNVDDQIHLSDAQVERLCAHDWPGNLRELLQLADALAMSYRRNMMMPPQQRAKGDELFDLAMSQHEDFSRRLSRRAVGDECHDAAKENGPKQ